MAIQKEIWEKSIVEGLFAPNSFLSKAFNADEYVEAGKIVHIPQAGAASKVEKNRTSLPATVKQRTDTDKTFELAAFTTDPVLIPDADKVELSYNKRESVLRQDKLALHEAVAKDFLFAWSPASDRNHGCTGGCLHTFGDSQSKMALQGGYSDADDEIQQREHSPGGPLPAARCADVRTAVERSHCQ